MVGNDEVGRYYKWRAYQDSISAGLIILMMRWVVAETTSRHGPQRSQKPRHRVRAPAVERGGDGSNVGSEPAGGAGSSAGNDSTTGGDSVAGNNSPTGNNSPPAGNSPDNNSPAGDSPTGNPLAGNSPTNTPTNNLAWTALIVGLLALAASGYVGYQSIVGAPVADDAQQQRIDAIERQLAAASVGRGEVGRFGERLGRVEEEFGERIRALRGEVVAERAAGAARGEKVLREVGVVAESVVALRSELGRGTDAWSLAEVEQLLEIANQRLQLSGDIELALRALKLAERRLRALPDPALAPVRERVAGEIVALSRVATVDVVGTLSALSALARSVDDLPLVGDLRAGSAHSGDDDAAANDGNSNQTTTPSTQTNTDDSPSSFWDAGKTLLADLGGLVQIETDGKSRAPILSAELRRIIFEKTKLILESCQLAFMRERGDVYAARMDEAKNWVAENFDGESAEVGAWLAQLTALAAVPPAPASDLPDISASLRALREATQSVK